MKNKVVLVTGASRGIGKAAAKKLLQNGYTVYGAARSEDQLRYLEEFKNGYYKILDVTEEDSRKDCISEILEVEGKIDILINNAGYGLLGAVEDISLEKAREQFDVNLFGLAGLTKLVLPSMRNNSYGKIINISSIAGRSWIPFGGWYNASKFALEGLSDSMRNELKDFGIDVILIEPGAVKTKWDNIASDNLLKNSADGPYSSKAKEHADTFKKSYSDSGIAVEPEIIAETIHKAIESNNPKARYAVPFHAKVLLFFKRILSDSLFDYLIRKAMG